MQKILEGPNTASGMCCSLHPASWIVVVFRTLREIEYYAIYEFIMVTDKL